MRAALDRRAADLGFVDVGVADAQAPWAASARLAAFLEAGRHGGMTWLADTFDRRSHPAALWPEAQSAVVLAASYAPAENPLALLQHPQRGAISAYAARRDYHDVLKGRAKTLAQWIAAQTQQAVKVFVDTAPLMEKPLAQQAGLGWQGKHTNLVHRAHGSWTLLSVILTQAHLAPDPPAEDHCGSCRACLDVCPTDAFPAPYQLDARRCIAYLTIEHDGPIPTAFRTAIGNRIFGCDDCLAVCPWNKFAAEARDQKMSARNDLQAQPLTELAALDDAAFRARFAGTPIKRTGRDRFVRNVLIALGNSADPAGAEAAQARLSDASPQVRGAAVWALRQLLPAASFQRLKGEHAGVETDPLVQAEWA
jgi:epoxyqueuosine reductase